MTYTEFVKKYKGTKIDYDGACGVQCVDLIRLYLDKVYGIKNVNGNGCDYYKKYNSKSGLNKNFIRIKNTSEFIPQKGDICVWGEGLGKWGHVAIATGDGTTSHFKSYDMNWGSKEMKEVIHSYKGFLGVLRKNPKTVNTKTMNLNIRKEPNTNCAIVGSLGKGVKITPLGETEKFTEITNGYCATEYLK